MDLESHGYRSVNAAECPSGPVPTSEQSPSCVWEWTDTSLRRDPFAMAVRCAARSHGSN